MKKKKTYLDDVGKKRIACLIWTLWCVIAFGFIIITKLLGYETNDDRFLATIPSGFYGEYIPYTIFNNIIQGLVLAGLSSCFPMINWTTTYYIILIVCSYIVIGCCFIVKKGSKRGGFFSVIFFLCTFISMICRMNFSKTGAMASVAGFILSFLAVDHKEWRSKQNIFLLCVGLLLLYAGSLVRYDTLVALLPFYFLVICFLWNKYNRNLNRCIPFMAVAVLLMISWGINTYVYKSNPDWKNYWDYIGINVIDYNVPDYEKHMIEYEKIGLTANDIELYKSWNYADEDVFNSEVMLEIQDIQKKEMKSITTKLSRGLAIFIKEKTVIFCIFISVFIFIFNIIGGDPKGKIFSVLLMSVELLEIIYLILINRCIEHSAMIPVLATIVLLLFFTERKKDYKDYFIGIVFMFIIFALCVIEIPKVKKYQTPFKDVSNKLYLELSQRKDCLFVWSPLVDAAVCGLGYSPMESFPVGGHANSVISGGWVALSPFMKEMYSEYGEKGNIYKILAENPNAYYVSSEGIYCKVIEKYIQEHYNSQAICIQVDEICGFGIYAFYTNGPEN